jgi:S-adenosylmethionine:tRNA ribosyltransferase-isomerase
MHFGKTALGLTDLVAAILRGNMNTQNLSQVSAFDFHLPPELIAQAPAATRTGSRLLDLSVVGKTSDRQFTDIKSLLQPGDLLVFNDTKVIKARLHGTKPTGGKIEALIERITGELTALAQVKASKTPQTDTQLLFDWGHSATVKGRQGEFYELEFSSPILKVLDQIGILPLPPYVQHVPTQDDQQRYQTVYARELGAVAAPTAGLHFDEGLMASLQSQKVNTAFVTLHVGAGTFQPVRADSTNDHVMHSERYSIPQETADLIATTKASGGRIIAVGTTSARTLEGAFLKHGAISAVADETDIFITPGYQFNVVDALITNFHLPKSTLMMLVTAFGGYERLMKAYHHAIKQQYRFFSFGDAMFITRE